MIEVLRRFWMLCLILVEFWGFWLDFSSFLIRMESMHTKWKLGGHIIIVNKQSKMIFGHI